MVEIHCFYRCFVSFCLLYRVVGHDGYRFFTSLATVIELTVVWGVV